MLNRNNVIAGLVNASLISVALYGAVGAIALILFRTGQI